jgi:hypothetical protein
METTTKKTRIFMIMLLSLAMIMTSIAGVFADTSADEGETMAVIPNMTTGQMLFVYKGDFNTCKVVKKGDTYVAHVRLNATGYDKLYVGTAEEAQNASSSSYITYQDEDGVYAFDIPVAKLNENFIFSSHSMRRDKWYEHSLIVFPIATATTVTAAAPVSDDAVKVSWAKQASENLTGYAVQYDTAADFSANPQTVYVDGADKTSTVIKGLDSAKTYYFRVSTYRHFDEDNAKINNYSFIWSEASAAKTFKTAPATKITKVKAGKKSAVVYVAKKTGYKYQIRYAKKSSMKGAKTISTSAAKKTIKKLSKGRKYYFQVRTYKKYKTGTVYSEWSSKKAAKIK